MENNVVSLETAKNLYYADFCNIQTSYVWQFGELIKAKAAWLDDTDTYDAPTAQEIANQITTNNSTGSLKMNRPAPDRWTCWLHDDTGWSAGDTMAEALATLWLKLDELSQ